MYKILLSVLLNNLCIIFRDSMNLHFGSNHSNRIYVLEVIFPSATSWVLVKGAGLMNVLSQTVGIQTDKPT